MENLKSMKNQLISLVQNQLTHTESVDTKELGEAVDMIKDLAETIYYCTITEAMEEKDKDNEYYHYHNKYYEERPTRPRGDMRDSSYREPNWNPSDPKEGRSHITRRYYMESKEKHMDAAATMKELEHYLSELSSDLAEMIEEATPEEKILLQQKLTTLVNKIK